MKTKCIKRQQEVRFENCLPVKFHSIFVTKMKSALASNPPSPPGNSGDFDFWSRKDPRPAGTAGR